MEYYLLALIIAAGLGLIPANIAKNKGYNFILWWFYGWMLFIFAIIHVNFIEDKSSNKKISNNSLIFSAAEELKKYKQLLDQGIISEVEFQRKKEEILKLI